MPNGFANPYGYGAAPQQHLNQGFGFGQAGNAPVNQIIVEEPGHLKSSHRQRKRMNVWAMAVSLFAPWLVYTLSMAVVSFRLHYKMPEVCWILVALGALWVVYIGYRAVTNLVQLYSIAQGYSQDPTYEPKWLMFMFLTSVVAIVVGPLMGNANFWDNMQPYYSLQNLNDYSSVDPTRMRGQQMMDAGRVQFLKGATLDLTKAYAFQNVDTYCVAPISVYNPQLGGVTPLASYDFWAVGINCCGGNSSKIVNFKCGAYKSPTAHEGLRLMADEPRGFLRLAVQQAEAAHMIKAVHPLFFHWSDNALSDMHGYLEQAYRNFAIGMCSFFAVQLVLLLIMSYVLSKTGYRNL